MVELFKVTFEKDFLFYTILIGLLLTAILLLLAAFVTTVHDGRFRKQLPGEPCDPNLPEDCGTGLVCEPHDETSHPFLLQEYNN